MEALLDYPPPNWTESPMSLVRRVRLTLSNRLSPPLRDAGKRLYDGWRQVRADHAFRRRNLPVNPAVSKGPEHVILVVVDALRADAIDPETTTFLDDLNGTSAVAPAPWTYPSVASLMTGRYPHEHGAIRQTDEANRGGDRATLPPVLPNDETTLSEHLAGAGFATFGGFGFTMPFLALKGRFGTHRLFDREGAATVLDSYRDWRAATNSGRTFAYLHLFDLHGPFDETPPDRYWDAHDVDNTIPDITSWRYTDEWEGEEVERYIDHRSRLYDAALDYVDDELAAFADEFDDVTLVVTSDHGEAFWEKAAFDAERFSDPRPAYSVGHGGTPYEPIARVPLLGQEILDTSGQVSLVDVAPTILNRVGLEPPETMRGEVLEGDLPDDRVLLIESARFGHEKKAVYLDGWKLLVSRGDDQEVGFTLPDESPCVLPDDVEAHLKRALPPWPSGTAEREVSNRVQRRLEDLGYA